MANVFRKISDLLTQPERDTMLAQIVSKITAWRVSHQSIVATGNRRNIDESIKDISPVFFQQAIGSADPIGLYIPKAKLIQALNNANKSHWDFLVCFIGIDPNTQNLLPTYHFYPSVSLGAGTEPVPGGTEWEIIGGGGGGGGGAANSTPPPTL